MKKTGVISFLLAIVMMCGIAAGVTGAGGGNAPDGFEVGDTGTLPDNNGLPTGDKVRTEKDPEKDLKLYGDIETLVKSVKTPAKTTDKTTSMSNDYGTVDWSMSHQGYITFTAKGQERVFILQGPNDAQGLFEVVNGDSIKVALTGGTGKYQYAIANNTNGGKSYHVMYKNSFNVKTIDSDLAPYLVSTPYGDYGNAPEATKKAKELWDSRKTRLENVKAISKYVRDLKYDKKLKQGTVDKYVNPDSVIENGGGVCNEKSKLLVAMLRSQGVPAYYQGGVNARGANHAWVCAWIELSSSTKNGVTSSKGAWVVIDTTVGDLQLKGSAKSNYSTESNNCAN